MGRKKKSNILTQFRWIGAMQLAGLATYMALLIATGKMLTMDPAVMFAFWYITFLMMAIGAGYTYVILTEKVYRKFADKRGYIAFWDLPPSGQARCADLLATAGYFQVVLAAALYKWGVLGTYDFLLVTIILAIGIYTFVRAFIIVNQKLLLHTITA